MKRRVEISQETNRLVVVRRRSKLVEAWCEPCGEKALMVTAEDAILISGGDLRRLVRQIDNNSIHYQETPEGLPLFCLNSLDESETGLKRLLPKENK